METERAICCSFFLFVSPMQRRAVMPLMKPLQRGRCIIVVGLSRGNFTLLYHHLPRLMISIHDCPPQSRLSDHRSGFSSCRFCSWSRGSIKDRSTPFSYVNEEHWTENAMRQYSKQSIGNCAWSPQNKLINGTGQCTNIGAYIDTEVTWIVEVQTTDDQSDNAIRNWYETWFGHIRFLFHGQI